MKFNKNRQGRRGLVLSVLLILSVALLLGTMMLATAAEDPQTYSLTLRFDLYDDIGEEGSTGIKVELAAGTPIDIDAIIADHPYVADMLADYVLGEDGYIGLPADGLMPAADLTITAQYAMEPFTITWVIGDTTVTDTVRYGELPVFPNGTPEKAPDAAYIYTFKGWDTDPVAAYGNATYTAQFDTTPNSHTVTFLYGDGLSYEVTVPYGAAATAPTEGLDKSPSAQYTYTFAGWDKDFSSITEQTTVNAVYTETLRRYTVTFTYGDGQSSEVTVEYGSAAEAPTEGLEKADTADHFYTFAGWDKDFSNIQGDLTVNALYNELPFKCTVTFIYGDGQTAHVTVDYGTAAEAPTEGLEKAETAQYTYTFAGWDQDLSSITSDMTVNAIYTENLRQYTVTFVYGDGKTMEVIVDYGSGATAPAEGLEKTETVQYTFAFAGWDKDFANITENTTVNAVYTETLRRYTVTFTYGDGKTSSVTVDYGTAATAPTEELEKPETADYFYTFAGWDQDFSNVQGNLTVNALYDEHPFKCTVTFVYGNGQTSEVIVDYGTAVTAPTEGLEKAPTTDYFYTFKGWDQDLTQVTDHMTVNALYDEHPFICTVTFVYGDGKTTEITVRNGEAATAPTEGLEKSATAQYTYTFAGWDQDLSSVTANMTVNAIYTETLRQYTVTFVYGDGKTMEVIVDYGSGATAPTEGLEKTETVQYTFTFAGWDKDFSNIQGETTVNALYTETLRKYTVTFHYGDGKTSSVSVDYGTAATAPTEDLEKASTADYFYTFAEWDKDFSNITGDLTVTALYNELPLRCTVTFVYGDGQTSEVVVDYGAAVTAPTEGLEKAETVQYTYAFKGWDQDLTRVTGHMTVNALYTETLRKYTVTFTYGDGKSDKVEVEYGKGATAPANTAKAPTAETVYTFQSWDKAFNNITGDLTVNAVYTEAPRKYTVTFNYGDGKSDKVEVEYGKGATAPTNTDKTATAQYTYTFKSWDKAFNNITGDLTVTAQYTETLRKYTVTFNYGDGKSDKVTVEYGKGATAPTNTDKAADDAYTYTFKSWDKAFDNITGDLTVTAQYDKVAIELPTEPETTVSEPETTVEPETTTPDPEVTTTPTEDTSEPDPEVTTPPADDTNEPTTDTAPVGSETETKPVEDGCGGSWIWIIVLLVVVAGVVVAIILIRKKNDDSNGTTPPPAAPAEPKPEAPAPEAPAKSTKPLFTPLSAPPAEPVAEEPIEIVEAVSVEEVDTLMTDTVAAHLLEASDEKSGVGKMGIINVGVISTVYQAGDTVDLADLQAKGMLDASVGRLKVLASGTLDKPLTIKADAFSVQAIKMITLTGGHAVKLGK